jgi:Zn-finger nucleic acid-binding protein
VNCPVDGATLVMSERQGVEIDYCPQCRGVWLDRGELDKIIERSDDDYEERPPRGADWRPERSEYDERRPERHEDEYRFRRKKKKSFFSEIFEFGDD